MNSESQSSWSEAKAKYRLAPLAQGVFFLGMSLWPLLHLRSFEAVTGPKVDDWLVKTIAGVSGVIGAALIAGAVEGSDSKAVRTLGLGSALTFAIADVVYVARGRISPVYLADAAAQLGIVTGWLLESRGADLEREPVSTQS